MSIYDRLVTRFGGQRPQITCWSPTEHRVSYLDWHLHDGASAGAPVADGKTLEAACARLLKNVDRPHVELVAGCCDQQCASRYGISPKFKLAMRVLQTVVAEAAAEVERWPAWKRGLPPCPIGECVLAAGHDGSCDPA